MRFFAGMTIMMFALFGCGPSEPPSAGGPPEVRRLTEAQYRNIIADLFGSDIAVAGRFDPLNRTAGLLEVGASSAAITPSAYEQYDALARSIAGQVVDSRHRDILVPCKPIAGAATDDSCARNFLGSVGRLLYRRPLMQSELDGAIALAHKAGETVGDFYGGLAYGLAAMLEAPSFLYIRDSAAPDPDHPGALKLDAYSKAARLSFLLWNTTPDDALLTAAEKGELDTRAGLARQVDRMLASPRLKTGIRAFFADMLGFDAFDTLAKDQLIYPAFTQPVGAAAQEQTLRTITALLLDQKADYRDLFTTRKTFMNGLLGGIYRVAVAAPGIWQPYEFPASDPHVGIATEISFVALHSHPGRSSATLRGKAVREVLLCQKVPDPPANVNFAIVQDTNNPKFRTARERLTAHRTEATCAGCHKLIDPIGLGLEHFDGAGQYRSQENGADIDTSGVLDGRPFADAPGLGRALHDDPQATTCLVQRLYAYATGRPATKGEKSWMEYLDQRFAAHGYHLPDLLRRIATSDAFYAVAPEETVGANANTRG
ncbi:MAG TPA: DUF1592 domain-containing protein [Alphaproteobacteria bacterium]|nr:DUF1592 domain-containing protein [Alphaproteobacteria bacterium]